MSQAAAPDSATSARAERLLASFREDGFVRVKGRLGAASVVSAAAYCDVLRERLGLAPGSALVAAPPEDAFLSRLVDSSTLAGMAAALLGARVSCFGVTYIDKPPRSGLPALWHQDLGPWQERLAGAPALTVWLALSDADESNGCLRVIPGSHTLPTHPLCPDASESLFGVSMDPAFVDESGARSIRVQAGDVVVHHANLIHASLPNGSARRRLALAVRYRAAAT